MNESEDTTSCAHQKCDCTLNAGEGIMIEGELYCCGECARNGL